MAREALVVIDTMRAFAKIRGKRDDIVEADYALVSALRHLAVKHATAMVVVDHSRKGAGDVIDVVIGTTGITAACDCVAGMVRAPGGDVVLTARGREHEELTYSMRFESDAKNFGWSIYGSGEEAAMSAERGEIITLLRAEAPLQPAKIALLLRKNANATRVLLTRMVAGDLVVKQAGGYVVKSKQK